MTNSVPKDRVKTGVITSGFPPRRPSLTAQLVKKPPAMQETPAPFLSREDLLEMGKATHSYPLQYSLDFPLAQLVRESTCNAGDLGSIPELGRSPWRRERQPTSVFWPGEFHGLYSPWGSKESGTTERLSLHFTTPASSLPPENLSRPPSLGQTASPSQPLLSPVSTLPNPRSPTPAAKEKQSRSRRPLSTQVSLYLDHGSAVYTGAPAGKKQ